MDVEERQLLLAKAGYQINSSNRIYKQGATYPLNVQIHVISYLRELEVANPTKIKRASL